MIGLIAILDRDGSLVDGQGRNPWVLDDLKRFVLEHVDKKTVLAGRKTWELFGAELPVFRSVVLSRASTDLPVGPSRVSTHLDVALERAMQWKRDVVVVGGASVFRQVIGKTEELQLAYVKSPVAEVLDFPSLDPRTWWLADSREHPAYELITYRRRGVA